MEDNPNRGSIYPLSGTANLLRSIYRQGETEREVCEGGGSERLPALRPTYHTMCLE